MEDIADIISTIFTNIFNNTMVKTDKIYDSIKTTGYLVPQNNIH